MKTVQGIYTTDKGIEIPIELKMTRLPHQAVLSVSTKNKARRDSWCTQDNIPCAKYCQRPCCPPNTPLFRDLPKRSHLYIFAVIIQRDDYFRLYPKVTEMKGKIKEYFFMRTAHFLTRGVVGNMSTLLKLKGEQTFKVGGCNGCTYAKDKKCKDFRPALEATGIDVPMLAQKHLKLRILWRSDPELLYMTAVSGLYTDREIGYSTMIQAFREACDMKGTKQ